MFDANEVINGLYGYVYDHNGRQMQETKSFEANVEYDKEEVQQAGRLMKGHKVMAASGTGSIGAHKLDSRLARMAADDPHAKYNFSAKLADPTARGEEYIMFIGVSFDSAQLMAFELGELGEVEMDFTFDDFEYLKSID
ncbi:phage tail tube protein [Blautia sp.]|uniref:phage tail tube protein n=1 Tax=Blautia sp. TaxID=1955243 RepID=UPI00258FF881|nr:phage tail tube protein [Blautia sp.]